MSQEKTCLPKKENKRLSLGNFGEKVVARHLESLGFSIKARNFRSRDGEIDIIAKKNELLAFIEVKARLDNSRFPLSSVITFSKQRKIIKTAKAFMRSEIIDSRSHVCRFDVVLVTGTPPDVGLQHIENAFQGS